MPPKILFNSKITGDWEAIIDTPEHLILLLQTVKPDARIVTDIGVSFIGGWGDIRRAQYYAERNILELFFD
jgi:hypothetical protein